MYSPTLRTEQSAEVVVIYFPTSDSGMNRMLLIKLVLAAGAGGAAVRFASHNNGPASGEHQVAAAVVMPTTAEQVDAPTRWYVPPDVFSSRDMHSGFAFFRNKGRMKEVDAGVPMSRLLLHTASIEDLSGYRLHPWNNSEYLGADTIPPLLQAGAQSEPPLLEDSARTSADSTNTPHALDCFVKIEDLFALYVPAAPPQRDSVRWTIMRTSGAIVQQGAAPLGKDTLFIPLLRLPSGDYTFSIQCGCGIWFEDFTHF